VIEEEVFLAAVELADPAERAAYLDRACGTDAGFRRKVEALLAAHFRSGEFLDSPAAGRPGDPAALSPSQVTGPHTPDAGPAGRTSGIPARDEQVGAILAGKYKLVELIGEGGMGSVYMAQQTEPVKRAVAVKVIKAGMDTRQVLARFEAERQALAVMDHPNIARVLDAGTVGSRQSAVGSQDECSSLLPTANCPLPTDSGRPFFVMELVKGVPITEFCDQRKLTPRQRLELFVPVCQAIQHAHTKGVIHRDIKPSNVLVALYDDRPVPKVIDFGVAKAAGQALIDKTLMTGFGAVIGTPEYMSPEQASLNNLDIDTRSDVYALGVLLYELLTGTTPVDRKSLGKAALLEVLRIVREVEAPRPSVRLSSIEALPSIAANRGTEPAQLSRLLRGELDWVVLKALEKERTRRYETANGLARDVQRYLADEFVEARPPSPGYRLRKFVRRNRLRLVLGAALAVLALGAISAAWWRNELARTVRERDARNGEAVAALLNQGEKALKDGDATTAALALEAAGKRANEGGAEGQLDRLRQLATDLALLRDLDEIDKFRWTWAENRFPDAATAATRTREALRQFGADPDAAPVEEVAARVSDSAVRERIVVALDRLLMPIRLVDVNRLSPRERKRVSPQMLAAAAALAPRVPGVRAVLRIVDTDPYRDAVRDAILANDRAKFLEVAARPAARLQPAGFVAFLGDARVIPVARRRELLAAAVSRQPGELGLLMAMGNTYEEDHQTSINDRLRWYQAAVAAAPTNAAAHNNLGIAQAQSGLRDQAYSSFQKAIALDADLVYAYVSLANVLLQQGRVDDAIAINRKAIARDPNCTEALLGLGNLLSDYKKDYDAAIECFQRVIALDPNHAWAHKSTCITLRVAGRFDEAIVFGRKAVKLDPENWTAYEALGTALLYHGREVEAIPVLRKAIKFGTTDPDVHLKLGNALLITGEPDEAIACYRSAIRIDPKFPLAHANLGLALRQKGLLDEALASFKIYLELDPKSANAHYYLGLALAGKGQSEDAIASYRRAIKLAPKNPEFRHGLGVTLLARNQVDEAIASLRAAVALNPKNATSHYSLGNALNVKGQLDAAIAAWKKAIEADAQYAEAHCNLWGALARRGRFAEALAAVRRGHELGSKRPEWPYPSSEWLRRAEAEAATEAKLPALLEGEYKPRDAREGLDLALVCQVKKLHRTAADLYAGALARVPELTDDARAHHQYDAACVAALAAAGQGEDAAKLDDTRKAKLRGQALDWLRAALTAHAKRFERNTPAERTFVKQQMLHWQEDADLASLRGAALANLPAAEREAFARLWADVARLSMRAKAPMLREKK
jgi:tetratricopeptide (TPR) repeat protein/serine/threonine protein kinase